MKKNRVFLVILLVLTASISSFDNVTAFARTDSTRVDKNTLPMPFQTKSTKNFSKVIGWTDGKNPVAPTGFTVAKFADKLEHPRWIYVANNGDVFVAESNTLLLGIQKLGPLFSAKIRSQHYGKSANRITLFRDADKNGIYENRFYSRRFHG